MDSRKHNRITWDTGAECGNERTIPVIKEKIDATKIDHWDINLTPAKPVPRRWFPDLHCTDILRSASGRGLHAHVFIAVNAHVTALDKLSPQLKAIAT